MDNVTVAYKVLGAVARKNPKLTIYMRTVGFPSSDRKLFEYIGEKGPYRGVTAYSEGFFESRDVNRLKWLAGCIHTEINQRLTWAEKGNKQYVDPEIEAPNAGRRRRRRGVSLSNLSEVAVPQD